MNKIYVARHGQSTWNSERRWAGHANPPLTDTGRLQAREACLSFAGLQFTSVTSSSLQRARETAAIIAGELQLPLLAPVVDIDERHYGELSGLTSEEIEKRWPDFMREWRLGHPVDIPGGEPWQGFVDRVFKGLRDLSALPGNTLVIAHIGVLRAIEYSSGKSQSHHDNLAGLWVDIRPST